MTQALFFLIPLACAIAMGFWLKHARQTGGRWITHWVATLAPLGLLAGLHSLGLVTQTLANVLMVPMVLGLAAFAGGALYLAGPTLLAGLSALWGSALFAPSLATQMKQANSSNGLQNDISDKDAFSFDEDNFDFPWSIDNTQRANRGIYDSRNAYGTFADDD